MHSHNCCCGRYPHALALPTGTQLGSRGTFKEKWQGVIGRNTAGWGEDLCLQIYPLHSHYPDTSRNFTGRSWQP